MIADLVAVGVVAGFALLGVLVGFGKGLRFFTKGIFGVIISIFVCYCIGGLVMKIPFVQELIAKFAALWADKEGFFFDIIRKIHVEIIVYYIALFIVVQIIRIIIVAILKHIAEAKVLVMKVINRILGAILFVVMGVLLSLLAFQIIYWIGGDTAAKFSEMLSDSLLGLDKLFENNPLIILVDYIKGLVVTG